MKDKKLTRREFLRMASLSAGGLVLTGCAKETASPEVAPTGVPGAAPTKVPTVAPTEAPTAVEEVVLEIHGMNPEYVNVERQIWDIYEAENPGVTIDLFSVNEDQQAAYEARIAGGWLPAIEYIGHAESINRDNYMNFVDLSTIDFPWFDRWQWDVRNTWSGMFGLSGPRALDFFQGIVASFIYHKDIIDEISWDPQSQVMTMDDLYKFLDDLTRYAADNPDLDFGWDRGWINGFTYLRYMNLVPVAFPDGGRDRQADRWWGRAKFNDPDSPFRHTFEFSKEMLELGYNAENWFTREWETDQEASFSAKRSALVLHGPWMWDKALAANPEAQLQGFPFPSVDGKKTIVHQAAPGFVYGNCLYEGFKEKPEWEAAKKAFYWWFSPPVVKMRCEAVGQMPLYDLDEPLELSSPQWLGLLQHVGTTWPHVEMDSGPWAETETMPYLKSGAPGTWDQGGGGYNTTFIGAIKGEIPIQDALDIAQRNWEASFELGPDGKLVVPSS